MSSPVLWNGDYAKLLTTNGFIKPDGTYIDNKSVGFYAHRNASDQTGLNPNASSVLLAFNSVAAVGSIGGDPFGLFDTSGNRFLVPAGYAGYYQISAQCNLSGTNILAGTYQPLLTLNGSTNVTSGHFYYIATAASSRVTGVTAPYIYLAEGDYITARLYTSNNHSASTLTMVGTVANSFFSGRLVGR